MVIIERIKMLWVGFIVLIIITVFQANKVEADVITVNTTQTSSTDSFPSNIWYNDGTRSGWLYKNGSSWVSSGSYIPADTKTVTTSQQHVLIGDVYWFDINYTNPGPNEGVYWRFYSSHIVDNTPLTYWYQDAYGYSGTLNYKIVGYDYTVSVVPYPTGTNYNQGDTFEHDRYYDWLVYTGQVTRQARDTRQYTQAYSGACNLNRDAVITDDLPTTIIAGKQYTVHYTVKNTGNYQWNVGQYYNLRSHDKDGTANQLGLSGFSIDNITGNVYSGGTVTFTKTFTAPLIIGTYRQELQMIQEGIGWFGTNDDKTVNVIDNIIPKLQTATIAGAQYINGNDYWVQPYVNLSVYTRYYDGETGIASVNLRNYSYDGTIDNRAAYDWHTGTSNQIYPSTAIKITNAIEGYNTLNTKDTTFIVQPQNVEQSYHVLSAAYDNAGNFDNYTFLIGNIRVDSTAPTGTVNYNYNLDTAQMNINISNIIEVGSGIKKIWIEYSPIDNPTNVITKNLTNVNGVYQDSQNLYSMFSGNADTVNIKIKALDNVGNQSTLSDTNNDVFMVKALIARVLTPNDNNFKSGEKGVLKISVYGGVDTLKITFPTELSSLDGTLNKTLTLTPKVSDSVNYEFFVPLEAPSKAYNVEVKAFKNGKEKDIYPSFTVNGTILNEIRTRLRVRS